MLSGLDPVDKLSISILNHEHTQEGASIKAHDDPIYFDGTA